MERRQTKQTDRNPAASLQKEQTRIKHWITTVSSQYNMETSYKVALRCWTLSGLSNQKRKGKEQTLETKSVSVFR